MSEKENGSSTNLTPWLIVGFVGVGLCGFCGVCSLIAFMFLYIPVY